MAPPKRNIASVLDLKAGEGKLIALPVLYSFFSGAALAFFVTASTSMFLTEFKSNILSLSFIASGVMTILIGKVFERLGNRLPYTKFLTVGVAVLLISVLALLGLHRLFNSAVLVFFIFAWIRIFTYLHAVTFWSLAGRLFSLQQAKRLFSLITGGEVFGSLVSFFSVPLLLTFLTTEDVLLISGVCLLFGFLILLKIIRRNAEKLSLVKSKPKPSGEQQISSDTKRIFLKNRYYKLFFLIAFLPIFSQLFVEFVFQIQAKAEFPDKETLTKFIGYFFGFSSLLEFVLKTFFAGRMLSRQGIRMGLSVMPLFLLVSMGTASFFGFIGTTGLFFVFVILARLFVRVIRTAFNDPATQILYQPLPEGERLFFQNKIESGPKAFATIAAGLLLFAFAHIPMFTLV